MLYGEPVRHGFGCDVGQRLFGTCLGILSGNCGGILRRILKSGAKIPVFLISEHGPTGFSPQPADIAKPHRSQHFEQLIPPGKHEVYNPGCSPSRIQIFNRFGGWSSIFILARNPFHDVHSNQQRNIHHDSIGPHDDGFGDVFGGRDPPRGHERYPVPQSLLHQ